MTCYFWKFLCFYSTSWDDNFLGPPSMDSHVQLKNFQVVENIKLPKHGGNGELYEGQGVSFTNRTRNVGGSTTESITV